jgi:hypothetical protein
MANTGVALSGSTGAVYYNPAGLASVDRNRISISANSYLKTSGEISPIQTFDGVDMNFHAEGLQTIPTSLVSSARWGEVYYAFSILIPHQLKIQDSTPYSSAHYPTMQFSRTNSFQLIEVGPSAAMRLAGTYDVGAGCFFTLFSSTQSSLFTANTNLATNAFVNASYYDANVSGLLCNAGVQVRMTNELRLGATLRLPLLPFSKSGTAMQFLQTPVSGQSLTQGPASISPEFRIPADFSLGAEYRLQPQLAAYFDVSYQAPATQRSGQFNEGDNKNKGTPRASAGLAYSATSSLDLFAGLGYNPSSVEVNDDDYAENFVVGTVGARLKSTNTNFGIGFLYAKSTGEKTAPAYDDQLNQLPTSKTASVSTTAFGVLISSGYLF